MSEDTELLRSYVQGGSEAAFAELVRRRINFVYSVALRQVGNDAHLASDVTQMVFVDLAHKARALVSHPTLPSWLYTSARFSAAKVVRQRTRQIKREQEAQAMNEIHSDPAHDAAWTQIRPVLDDAMHELAEPDRAAIVLRYFEGLSLADVGMRLGLAENSARMRVERALDKLRLRLARRGIVSTVAALGSTLVAQSGISAPTGLAVTVTSAAVSGGMAGSVGTVSTYFLMTTQTKIVAVTALLALLTGFGGYRWKARQIHSATLPVAETPTVMLHQAAPVPSPTNVPVTATAPVLSTTPQTKPAETPGTLRARGAAVQVPLWDPSGKFEFSAEAKRFFKLNDEEAAKILDLLKQRMKEITEVAARTAEIRSNDGKTIVVTVPPGPGEKVKEQFAEDMNQLLGLERGTEFLDMGARDLAVRLRQGTDGGRTLTLTRSTPFTQPDGTVGPPVFRFTEDLGVTHLMGFSNLQNRDGSADWLSRFSPELNDLELSSPPAGTATFMSSDGVAR